MNNHFTPEFRLKSVLNTDSFDRSMYQELRDSSKTLQKTEEEGSKNYTAFPHLLGDTWAGLFKNLPEINPICPKGVKANQALMEHVLQNPEFQAMREYTKLDELASALGASQLSSELDKIISQNKEVQEAQKQAQEQQEKLNKPKMRQKHLKKPQKWRRTLKKQDLLNQAKKELSKMKSAEKKPINIPKKHFKRCKSNYPAKMARKCLV